MAVIGGVAGLLTVVFGIVAWGAWHNYGRYYDLRWAFVGIAALLGVTALIWNDIPLDDKNCWIEWDGFSNSEVCE